MTGEGERMLDGGRMSLLSGDPCNIRDMEDEDLGVTSICSIGGHLILFSEGS